MPEIIFGRHPVADAIRNGSTIERVMLQQGTRGELEIEMRQMASNMGMFNFKSASGAAMKEDMEKKIEKLGRDVERLKTQHRELLKELR